jgi:predicted esterase
MIRERFPGLVLAVAACVGLAACGSESPAQPTPEQNDDRPSLRRALEGLSSQSGETLLGLHFRSVLQVVDAGDRGSSEDSTHIKTLLTAFSDPSVPRSPMLPESYLTRSRPLIVSWVSPTDGQVSFAWLTLPANWDSGREYPVYVQLHGLWEVAQERLRYLAYPYSSGPGTSFAFEDGYLISPWGRGNQWYRGISETDIWEGLAFVKSLVRIDADRQYLCGHSMGGYGAWHIAHRSAGTWAALGLHAAALQYDGSELTPAIAAALSALPTYIVVGTADGLLSINAIVYAQLRDAGNPQLSFVTFPGGHEYRQQDVEKMYLWMRQFERGSRRLPDREP